MANKKIPLIDLSRQHKRLGPSFEAAFRRVVRKGQFILGPEVISFEKSFAAFCQSPYGVGVASGSDALELSLQQDQDHRLALLEARETQATLNAKHATALKDTGAPPPDVSFETYIEMIAKAASRNELQIIRHIPLDSQAYPGLIVRQFTIEVAGTFGDLMEFLRITEAMNCWADISHFKIDKPVGLAGDRSRIQSALLTFALFSSDSERFRGGT